MKAYELIIRKEPLPSMAIILSQKIVCYIKYMPRVIVIQVVQSSH